MASVPTLLIRIRAAFARWPRVVMALASSLAVAVIFGLGVMAGHHSAVVHGTTARAFELAKRNEDLQNQLAVLQRDRQVSQIADRVLQKNLSERDEEIRGLRADQAFYSKLVGADARPGGLTVHGLSLKPVARTHAFNFVVTLTHSAEGGKEIDGHLSIAVEGIRADKLLTLDWNELGGPAGGNGVPFEFKYFQQVQGTLMLPPGFTPNRLQVTLDPADGHPVTRIFSWSEVLHGGSTSGMP